MSEPQPVGPSEPEAPVVPHAHEEDATESAPEPEGPEERPADSENAPAESAPEAESAQPSESELSKPTAPEGRPGREGA